MSEEFSFHRGGRGMQWFDGGAYDLGEAVTVVAQELVASFDLRRKPGIEVLPLPRFLGGDFQNDYLLASAMGSNGAAVDGGSGQVLVVAFELGLEQAVRAVEHFQGRIAGIGCGRLLVPDDHFDDVVWYNTLAYYGFHVDGFIPLRRCAARFGE